MAHRLANWIKIKDPTRFFMGFSMNGNFAQKTIISNAREKTIGYDFTDQLLSSLDYLYRKTKYLAICPAMPIPVKILIKLSTFKIVQ